MASFMSKKFISIILVVAMVFANNGFSVFAESMEITIDEAQSEKKETPNYYYEDNFDEIIYEEVTEEKTVVEEYEAYLEEKNPGVFEDEKEDYIDEIEKEEAVTEEYEEVDIIREENSIEEEKEEKEDNNETINNASESEINEEKFNEEELIATNSECEIDEIEKEVVIESEIINNDVEETFATDSESKKKNEATESEVMEKIISSELNTKEEDVATESDVNSATESEVDFATDSETEASESEVTREKFIATVSKISWKVKKILIATYSTTYVYASESEMDREARLATCANVILVDDDGNEKIVTVPLKWKLEKKINVDAHTKKNEKPVRVEEWRKKYEINKIISEQEKEVVVATKAFSDFALKIKNDHEEEIEKEIIVVEKEKEIVEETDEISKVEEKTNEVIEEFVNATVNEIVDEMVSETADETVDTLENVEVISPVSDTEKNNNDEIIEPTVADFAGTDLSSNSEIMNDDKQQKEKTDSEIATISEAEEKSGIEKEMVLSDYQLGFMEVESINLFKVDIEELSKSIAEIINEKDVLVKKEVNITSPSEVEEKSKNGILDNIFSLFGINKIQNDEKNESEEIENIEKSAEEELLEALINTNVEVVEESEVSSIIAEQDAMRYGDGATHTSHKISQQIKDGSTYKSKIVTLTDDEDTTIGDNAELYAFPDLSVGINEINLSGTFYLQGDLELKKKIKVNGDLYICTNGHNITFATMGYILADPGYRVVICNCKDSISKICTGEPTYNYKDRFYATTSETYVKYHENPLIEADDVLILGKYNAPGSNINFEGSIIKNQYVGVNALAKMQTEYQKLDEPETSGGGSLLYARHEMKVYNADFKNNIATRTNGVAINTQMASLTLEKSNFIGNKNLTNVGGAIAINPKSTYIYDCVFESNTSETMGGAIYGRIFVGSATESGTKIEKTTFKENKARLEGGAIFFDYIVGTIKIGGDSIDKKVSFEKNEAGNSGGAIAFNHNKISINIGSSINTHEQWPDLSKERNVEIENVDFKENKAKTATGSNENFGGAVYINNLHKIQLGNNSSPITEVPLIKNVKIKNATFEKNIAEGKRITIKEKIGGVYAGSVLAEYYLGNYGGAIYVKNINDNIGNGVKNVELNNVVFDENVSMTGAGICAYNTQIDVKGGAFKKGKAKNDNYKNRELIEKIITPGGGAIYLMDGAEANLSETVSIIKNRNAFYLDGGIINLGESIVEENEGEYLIGYSNYTVHPGSREDGSENIPYENRILFNGVDIENHTYYGAGKDYNATISYVSGTDTKNYHGKKQNTYVSFASANTIKNNSWIITEESGYTTSALYNYTEDSKDYRKETCNIAMISSRSNLQIKLNDHSMYKSTKGMIGLYYYLANPDEVDDVVEYTKWTYADAKVLREGGIWTNYFEVDQSKSGERLDGWKFYINGNKILMSPNIFTVKFDSYIEGVEQIAEQHYNYKNNGQLVTITTPTEIIYGSQVIPGKTFIGFLGRDKSIGAPASGSYVLWDFNVHKLQALTGEEETLILVYSDDEVKLKACGCPSGIACSHDNILDQHIDRGMAMSDTEEAHEMNYIIIATMPQFAYRYGGKKTQYVLNKDLQLSAKEAKEFLTGDMILNLNGKTLTYDVEGDNNNYIFGEENPSFEYTTDNLHEPGNIFIVGNATTSETAPRGKIKIKGKHNGSFINTSTKNIYINRVDFDGEEMIADSTNERSIFTNTKGNINTKINIENSSFENITLNDSFVSSISNVILKRVKTNKNKKVNIIGKPFINLGSTGVANASELKVVDSVIEGVEAESFVNIKQKAKGTDIKFENVSILENKFDKTFINLDKDIFGNDTKLTLKGKNLFNANEILTGNNFLTQKAPLVFESSTSETKFDGNIVPIEGTNSIVVFDDEVILDGAIKLVNNRGANAVYQTEKATISVVDAEMYVTGNNTTYEWMINNVSTTKEMFVRADVGKFRASESVVEIKLKNNDVEQKVWRGWKDDNLKTTKIVEKVFVRDLSYPESDRTNIYKGGLDDALSIYFGTDYVKGTYYLYPYRAGEDERETQNKYDDVAKLNIQRIKNNTDTKFDGPRDIPAAAKVVMWEGLDYVDNDGKIIDTTKECIYPQNFNGIIVNENKDFVISGYSYRENANRQHRHDVGPELWMEARNEGHLQASTSYIFLHNDIEITHPMLNELVGDYIICLNGHKLIIATDSEWLKGSDGVKINVCDCSTNPGAITVKNGINYTKDIISATNSEIKIENIKVSAINNIVGRLLKTKSGKLEISKIEINNVKIDYSAIGDEKSFIEVNKDTAATYSELSFISNTIKTNTTVSEKQSIMSMNVDSASGKEIELAKIKVDGNATDNKGSIVLINGYKKVVLNDSKINNNTVYAGSALNIKGSGAGAVFTINGSVFSANTKVYDSSVQNNTANFDISGFDEFYMNDSEISDTNYKNPGSLTSDVYTALYLDDVKAKITNTTISNCNKVEGSVMSMYTVMVKGTKPVTFDNCTFKDIKSNGSLTGIIIVDSSYTNTFILTGSTKLTNLKASYIVDIVSVSGKVVFDDITLEESEVVESAIHCSGAAEVIATNSIIKNIKGTSLYVSHDNVKLYNTEITGTPNLYDGDAIYVTNGKTLTVGDKVIIKGYKNNLFLSTGAKLTTEDDHMITKDSIIYLTVANGEQEIFDSWSKKRIEDYEHFDESHMSYFPSDLFKLDDAQKDTKLVYAGGGTTDENTNVSVYVNDKTADTYATLIYRDDDVENMGELIRQYIKAEKVTRVDKVKVPYLTTPSQMWNADLLHATDSMTAWKMTEYYTVNLSKEDTYNVYLVKKHTHKECGIDIASPCDVHIDGNIHTTECDFVAVADDSDFRVPGRKYFGLAQNIKISQESLNYLAGLSTTEVEPMVICLHGHILTFATGAKFNVANNVVFTNCEPKGYITTEDDATDVLINSTGGTLKFYNTVFKSINTTKPIIAKSDNDKFYFERTTFSNITLSGDTVGMIDFGTNKPYINGLAFDKNIATGSTVTTSLLKLSNGNFEKDRVRSVTITNNKFLTGLIRFNDSYTYGLQEFNVKNNVMLGSVATPFADGAIYVAFASTLDVGSDFVVEGNDASINENSIGGALSLFGKLNVAGDLVFKNNKAAEGGALIVGGAAKIVASKSSFIGNEADFGAAISGSISDDMFSCDEIIFDANKAKTHGVVYWNGELKLENVTFKNHPAECKELLYNKNASDVLTLDKAIFKSNVTGYDAICLNEVGSTTKISNITNETRSNKFENFINLNRGNATFENIVLTNNNFINAAINISTASGVVNLLNASIKENTGKGGVNLNQSILGIKGKEEIENIYVSDDNSYARAVDKISTMSKLVFTTYKDGTKVFEKWNESCFDNYDKPTASDISPRKYAYTPENSGIFVLSEDAINKTYEYYKVGDSTNQDIYLGSSEKFVKVTFYSDEVESPIMYVTQNIEKGAKTRLDKVDTQETNVSRQSWRASNSVTTEVWTFKNHSTNPVVASVSENIAAYYIRPHIHKSCGCDITVSCSHEDIACDPMVDYEYKAVANQTEIETLNTSLYNYVYFVNDINITGEINIPNGLKGICLNGYKIIKVGDNHSLIKYTPQAAGEILSICDCKNESEIIISGEKAQVAPVFELNSTGNIGHLAVYNMKFASISLAAPIFKNNTGDVNSHIYAECLKIENLKDISVDGIADNGGEGTVYIATFSVVDSNINENSLIVLKNNMKFGNLYIADNESQDDLIKSDNVTSVSIRKMHVNNNKISNGAVIHVTNSNIEISEEVSVSKNETTEAIFNVKNNSKINIGDTAVFINNSNIDGDGGVINIDSSRFSIASSSVFSNNKANNGAAIFARNISELSGRSNLMIDDAVFMGNEVCGGGHGVINYTGVFDSENVSFINHTPLASELIYAGDEYDNTLRINKIIMAGNTLVNSSNHYDAIYIKKSSNSFITDINNEKLFNNKFNNFLKLDTGDMDLSDIIIDENSNTFEDSIINIKDAENVSIYDDFVIKNQNVTKSALLLENSKVVLGSNKSTKKTKVVVKENGNGKNILLLDNNSYFKGLDTVIANDNISSLSELYIKPSINGLKVYDGWNEKNIDGYNHLVSTELPIKYMYTPEMSGIFKPDGVNNYDVFKKGTESVCMGDTTKYVILTFKREPDFDSGEDESVRKTYGTQNIANGNETKLDLVDIYDYELKKQEWEVPGLSPRWCFVDDSGNIVTVKANETSSKDVVLLNKHLHKICGDSLTETCMHIGTGENHTETIDYYYVATEGDLSAVPISSDGKKYIALKKDILMSNSAFSDIHGICLNGHTITYKVDASEDYYSQLLSLSNKEMSICDCKHDRERHGAFTLYNTNTGNNTKKGSYIRLSVSSKLNLYNIHFATMSFTTHTYTAGSTTRYYDGCLVFSDVNCKVYMDHPVFDNIQRNGKFGLFGGRNSSVDYNAKGIVILDSPVFTHMNSGDAANPIIQLNEYIKISTLSMINNVSYGNLINVDGNRTLNEMVINKNFSSAGSMINIGNGNSLTITGKNVFKENSGNKGGVFNIAGKLVSYDEVVFDENTGSANGGAIYMSDNGKMEAHATVSFIGNIGNGAAIYARNINSDALDFTKAIFDNNKSEGAIIDFTGKLKLANVEFKNHESTSTNDNILIKNSGTAGTDQIDLSRVSFINNNITKESAILLNKVGAGSIIHDIDTSNSSENTFKNLIDIQNESNIILENLILEEINCTENVVKVDNSNAVDISTISIINNIAEAGLCISNDNVSIKNKIVIKENSNKNIYLADENAYLIGVNDTTLNNYLDKESVLSITTTHPNQKVFYGWNENNIEKYDNPDKTKNPIEYMYTPENSGIFVKDNEVVSTYEFYKDGDTDDQGIYLGDDFVKLKFYNDSESLDEPITYGTQNIKKNATVKLDKVDSFEYELKKQEWKAPNPPNSDVTWKFANPITGVEQDVKANYDVDTVIKYLQKHIHKLCGKTLLYDCDHIDTSVPVHTTTAEYIEIGQEDIDDGFSSIAPDAEYLVFKEDVVVNGTLMLPAGIKGLCLNGHEIKSYASINALIDVMPGIDFNICNCKENRGYITIDGTQTGDFIKANGTKLRIYNTEFRGINTTKALISANSGDTYLENVKFTELKGTGDKGVLSNTESGTYTIANLVIDNNELETMTPLLTINDSMTISTISVTNNKTKASVIKFDSPSINFGSLVVKGNESTGDGTIYIPVGTNLILDKEIEFSDNKAKNGGAFYVAGTLAVNMKTTFVHNIATEKGGAIYIANGGKVIIDGNTLFERNEAKNGSAIYAVNLSTNDLMINKESVFKNENAKEDGVISWHGELNLSSPSFIGNTGTCGSLLVNEGGSSDKLLLIGAKFIDNNIPAKDAIKLNEIGEANIKNLYIQKGTINSKYANAINIIGGTVNFTENLNISENTFNNSGINIMADANVVFNGNVKVEKNTSAKGAVYIGNGTNVEIQGRSLKVNSNITTGNFGAALTIDNPANINTQIETFEIIDNKSENGGAIYVNGVMGISGTTKVYVYDNKLANGKQKNIYIANDSSYIRATDIINENSKLGFSAAGNNYKVFEVWNNINFTKIDNPTGDYSYTPENSGIFVLDDESIVSKYEFYKSGIGTDEVIKLGKNFITITFKNTDKSVVYSKQNIEKDVLTKLDVVKSDASHFINEKWMYPDISICKAFIDGDVNVKYSKNQEIIKSFRYTVVYTAGSKENEVMGGNISSETHEYGEEFTIKNCEYVLSSPSVFRKWNLRAPVFGIPASYTQGSLAKDICTIENGIVYLDAMWDNEHAVRFYPNGEPFGQIINSNPSFTLIKNKGTTITLPVTYDKTLVPKYTYNEYGTSSSGGTKYNIGDTITIGDDDIDLYCMWTKGSSGPSSGGGGSGGGNIQSGGYIIDGLFIPFGPGVELIPEYQKPTNYYVDEAGFIRDMNGEIVGNTFLGEKVNDDGTFTDMLGYIHRLDGTLVDAYGNVRNIDGSITTVDGRTYYFDGSVKDKDGLIYYVDGTIKYPDGSIRDGFGLIHRVDGSIVTADGIIYYIDGSIEYPDGTKILPDGVVMKNDVLKKSEGVWEYDPVMSGWKFFTSDVNGNKTYYKDEWVATENKDGNVTWYAIDNYGNMATGWIKSNGDFYYMSPASENRGELMKGEINIAGKLYKLDYSTGKLLDNVEPENFSVMGAVNHKSGEDGEWKDTNEGKMFIKKNIRVDGLVREEIVKGWFMVDGHYYLFNDDGIALTGLIISDGKYYYLEKDGKLLEGGEKVIDGVTYVFDKATGACRSSRVDIENLL